MWSEAAVWIAEGWRGVQQYREDRLVEVKSCNTIKEDIAYFHDGSQMLGCVRSTLDSMESRLPSTDNVTVQVCERLIMSMLNAEAKLRLSGKDLWDQTQNVLREARALLNVNNSRQAHTFHEGDGIPDLDRQKPGRTYTVPVAGPADKSLQGPKRRVQSTSQPFFASQRHYGSMVETPIRGRSLVDSAEPLISQQAHSKLFYKKASADFIEEEATNEDEDVLQVQNSPEQETHNHFTTASRHSVDAVYGKHSHSRNDTRIGEGASDYGANAIPQPRRSTRERKRLPRLDVTAVQEYIGQKRDGIADAYLEQYVELRTKLGVRDHVRFLYLNLYS